MRGPGARISQQRSHRLHGPFPAQPTSDWLLASQGSPLPGKRCSPPLSARHSFPPPDPPLPGHPFLGPDRRTPAPIGGRRAPRLRAPQAAFLPASRPAPPAAAPRPPPRPLLPPSGRGGSAGGTGPESSPQPAGPAEPAAGGGLGSAGREAGAAGGLGSGLGGVVGEDGSALYGTR